MTKQQAKEKIKKLISRYENLSDNEKNNYNEQQTKDHFIRPLFEALGWDFEKDVWPETDVSGKRVDYAFKANGVTKFFLEAKPLSINLDEERWAEQAINYSWHKSVPWVILSDFEAIKIFNTEWDTPDIQSCQFVEIPYTQYLSSEKLWWLSPDSFLQGILDKKAEEVGRRPKRIIDSQLAIDLIKWRTLLYKDLKGYNPKIDEIKISEYVQKILDRLIFIRTLEDRKIEDILLQQLTREWSERPKPNLLLTRLNKIFRQIDKDYNSGLFEEAPYDHLGKKLDADDNVFAEVINELYKTKDKGIRYNFADIPSDVFGSIYEQYLGHIQKEDSKNKNDKLSKRKSQGIYYTPRYIVNYIVQNTLGELLKGNKSEEIKNIKILDPACGSGSFLINAYQTLIDYWQKQEKHKFKGKGDKLEALEVAFKKRNGVLVSSEEKMRILLRNIYGVDLDEEAVEIARLNLLLKMVGRRAKLPKLDSNIQVGNSLISGTKKELKKYFGNNWLEKKPFNWQEKFDKFFKLGGFDVVIGNPPWVTLLHSDIGSGELNYFKGNYTAASGFKLNLFPLFLERALQLCKKGGLACFIIPNRLLDTPSYRALMKKIIDNYQIKFIVDIPKGSFEDVVAGNIIICIQKSHPSKEIKIYKNIFDNSGNQGTFILKTDQIISKDYLINLNFKESLFDIFSKIGQVSIPLKDVADIHVGIMIKDKKKVLLFQNFNKANKIILGRDIDRYKKVKDRFFNLGKAEIFGGTKNPKKHLTHPKIFVRKTGNSLIGAYDEEGVFAEQSVYLVLPHNNVNPKYLLSIINSKLQTFYFKNNLITNPEAYPYIQHYDLEKLPIYEIDISKTGEKYKHDQLVRLVEMILKLNKELQKLDPIMDKEEYNIKKAEIEKIDKEIDEKVYELYGLTEEEIKSVEKDANN